VALVLATWIGLHFLFQEVFKVISWRKAAVGNSYDGYAREVSIGSGCKGMRQQEGGTLGLSE